MFFRALHAGSEATERSLGPCGTASLCGPTSNDEAQIIRANS